MLVSVQLFQFGFDLNFLDGQPTLASFHVFVDHFYIFFLEYVYSDLLLILKLDYSLLLILRLLYVI